MKSFDQDVLDLGYERYEQSSGLADMERDSDGFIILKPTAEHVDKRKSSLTTDIGNLEAKLKQFKQERDQLNKYQKTEDYKKSKKSMSKKKIKKKRDTLLEMVFNNADKAADEEEADSDTSEEEDGISYRDSRKTKSKNKKTSRENTTLDTTYGKRFSPMVAMLYDTITEFDKIANDIEDELSQARNSSRSMYRSSQISNLLAAKKSKMDAITKLTDIAKTVSDFEYKKDKDRQANEGSDSSKAISNLAAKYLRGAYEMDDKSKKNKDKSKKKKNRDYDDDDDEVDDSIKKQRESDNRALAEEFAKTLGKHKGDIKLTPHELYARMEGKYTIQVLVDPFDESDWKFVAVSTKTGKIMENFKDDYPGLLPKKKDTKMIFDIAKLKCTDKISARSYKLILKK